jgi:hypothetical protein
MAELNYKFPTSQEDMNELRKMMRQEVSEEELDAVTGGNDDPKMKGKFDPPVPWVCPGCGATIMVRQFMDGPKHMTKCPGNPYK